MEIEYFYERVVNATLNVDDIGNTAIRANNDAGYCWYFITDTSLGKTRILEYGPINPDFDLLPDSLTCSFSRIDFNSYKIASELTKFLNNGRNKITQAIEIDKETALDECKDLIDYMRESEV